MKTNENPKLCFKLKPVSFDWIEEKLEIFVNFYRWRILNSSSKGVGDIHVDCDGGSSILRRRVEKMLTGPEVQKKIEREQKRIEDIKKKYNINLTITVTKTPP